MKYNANAEESIRNNQIAPTPVYPLCPILTQVNHVIICLKEKCMLYDTVEDECALATRVGYRSL